MKKIYLLIIIIFLLFLQLKTYASYKNHSKAELNKSLSSENNTSSKYFINQERNFNFSQEKINIETESTNTENKTNTLIDSSQYYSEKAEALLELVESEKRYIKRIDRELIINLPVGIKKDIGGLEYILLIDEINLKPDGAFFNALMSFEIPQNGKKLVFKGLDIPFSFSGGLKGDVKLELVTRVPMPIGDGMELIINNEGKTHATWTCDGFKEMAVDADILFDPGIFVPEDEQGNIIEGKSITSHFNINIADWNDLIVQLSIEPFQVKGIEGIGFEVTDAVFDFSDYRNAPNVQFPDNYMSSYFTPGNPSLWRGIFIRQAAIRLPKQFKTQEGNDAITNSAGRLSFIGKKLIIDDAGFSGTIMAENLLSLEQGQIGNWAFSLNKMGISLEAGQLTKAGFEGEIIVPVMDKESPLKYTALIDLDNEYTFNVSTTDKLEMAIWSAKVDLKPASYLEIKLEDDEFVPKACLHGQASIEIASDGLGIGADFESLVIQTKKPYLSCQAFSLGLNGMESKMGNFPISVNNVGFQTVSDTKMGIKFDLILNLVGEEESSFGAEAGLLVVGSMNQDKGLTSWRYSYLDLTRIAIDINAGAYKIKGSLTFFKNDETYGNGFNGQVSAEFIDIIKVDATAIFGKVDNYRYWYVDALMELPVPITVAMFQITSFGGGAFHYMRQLAPGETVNSDYGRTISGIVYRPDKAVYLGIKATIGMSTVSESIFNGDATLEVTFGNGGGLRTIDFRGNAYFVTPPLPESVMAMKEKVDKMTKGQDSQGGKPADSRGSISGHIRIYMDFPNKVLHANIEVYAELAGGLIKGVGSNGLAGWSVFHFEPGEWYIHMGSPDKPVGIELLGMVKLESYFMVGHNIPGSPPPPAEVSRILGDIDLDYMGDMNALGEGKGIAFGSRFSIDTGDLTFLMFYARFAAGLGFDIMMKDYGNAQCKGRDGVIGMNGWYANGQSFAYMTGKIGIKVKVFGKKIQKEILDIGAASVLQAKLPNPFWMRGIVGGYFSILGGMVKGDCKFEVVLGEECELVPKGSIMEELNALQQITPVSGQNEVDVFATPQAVFNFQVGKEFQMIDYDEKKKSFRIKLDYFNIYQGTHALPLEKIWNDDHTVLAVRTKEVLPGKDKLTAKVQISFEQKSGSIWEPVKVDGEIIREIKETQFTTGERPKYFKKSNIAYCYPMFNQYNFYQDEYKYGYMKLIQSQAYLFQQEGWKQVGRITSTGGGVKEFNVSYNTQKDEVQYIIPDGLSNNQIHKFEIVSLPIGEQGTVDRNVSEISNNINNTENTASVSISRKVAEGSIDDKQETNIITTWFRTSMHNTFRSKIIALSLSEGWTFYIRGGVYQLGTTARGPELFAESEMYWDNGRKPLIRVEAQLNNTPWYVNEIKPTLYKDYPIQSRYKIEYRDPQVLGVPPAKAIKVFQLPYHIKLTDEDISANTFMPTPNVGGIAYNLSHYMEYDFGDIQTEIANVFSGNTEIQDPRLQKIMEWQFPIIEQGNYPIKIKYVIPGREITTTNYDFTIYNPVKR